MLSKGNKPWWSGSSAGDCPRARPARRRATVAPSASVAATAAATDKHWPFLRHPGTKENGSLGMSCRIDVNDVMRPLAILGRTFGAAGQTLDGAPDLVEPDERVGLVLVLQQQLQTQKRRHLKNDNQKKTKHVQIATQIVPRCRRRHLEDALATRFDRGPLDGGAVEVDAQLGLVGTVERRLRRRRRRGRVLGPAIKETVCHSRPPISGDSFTHVDSLKMNRNRSVRTTDEEDQFLRSFLPFSVSFVLCRTPCFSTRCKQQQRRRR